MNRPPTPKDPTSFPKKWAVRPEVDLPTVPAHCQQAYHLYWLLLPSVEARQDLIRHHQERGVNSVFHYLPLHLPPMGRRFGGKGDLSRNRNDQRAAALTSFS